MTQVSIEHSTPITIAKPAARVVVRYRNHTIADTENALAVEEPNYSPVFYLPKRDVDLSALVPSTTITFCPRKGHDLATLVYRGFV